MFATNNTRPSAHQRTRRRRLRSASIAAVLTVLVLPVTVFALSSYGTSWSAVYPTSLSRTNAGCTLCHGADTSTWNAYGQAIRNEMAVNGRNITNAIKTVESANSDGDPGGVSNLAEIQANSQPGWTLGNNNTIYDIDGVPTTGQPVPAEPGALVRVLLESLALRYAAAVDQLSAATGHPVEAVHVVGGGSNNRFLCRLTAGATGLPVRAGPVEATAAGNLAVQAIAAGELASVAEARELVARSFPVTSYEPEGEWAEARSRFATLLARAPAPATQP